MKILFINKIAIILLLLFNIANSEVISRPNILFLHSYHPSSVWTKEVNKGMNSIFNDTNKYNIYIEFMDTKRYNTKKHFNNLKNIYNEKYKNIKFDVIISSDDNAFNFLKKYNQTIFKDSPVIFCGVNNLQKEDLIGFNNFTGVTEENDIEKNFDLIIKLHPNTKTIYNLVDTTTTGKAVKKLIVNAINNSKYKNIKFEFIDDLTMEQLIENLNSYLKIVFYFIVLFLKLKIINI